jgi:uncharacterized cofD-like protein
MKVVVIGGGSGLATLLRGIRDYPFDITAIVTMTDNGSSTGRLRKDLGILPPGDIRKCIAALSKDESKLIDLFEYRFEKGKGLSGHSLGNLLISALEDLTGSFEGAVEQISQMLSINGNVYPATLEDVDLCAEFDDGKTVVGESQITKYGYGSRIKKIFLTHKAKTNKRALNSIKEADLVLIGPGSLYTSVIPNFLLEKIRDAVKSSKAFKIYICNVSTERGETDGFRLSNHINVLKSYGVDLDAVITNNKVFGSGFGDGYVMPVKVDLNNVSGLKVFTANIVDRENPLYHDSKKLGRIILEISTKYCKNKKPASKIFGRGL